ncbi:hypothetical protein L798_14400 [Zootermopsis nevadensis]|uniref:Uncharacterized protein n=1 Tax=Zootermopsis nevadensis TaxID=136037 RepID=A0A067QYC4_ZOONE|nr:hypothetical protein L798_14400 [Zootermopsis nevadensis]
MGVGNWRLKVTGLGPMEGNHERDQGLPWTIVSVEEEESCSTISKIMITYTTVFYMDLQINHTDLFITKYHFRIEYVWDNIIQFMLSQTFQRGFEFVKFPFNTATLT